MPRLSRQEWEYLKADAATRRQKRERLTEIAAMFLQQRLELIDNESAQLAAQDHLKACVYHAKVGLKLDELFELQMNGLEEWEREAEKEAEKEQLGEKPDAATQE